MSGTDVALPTHLPEPKQVKDLFTDLLDRAVELRPGPPFAVSPSYPASIASFVDDRLIVRAVVALDLPLSAHLGSALALVPASGAEAAIEDGALPDSTAEGLSEVFNVMASLFNTEETAHVKLYQAHCSGAQLPHDARARTQILGRREDYLVDVAGYGSGRLAVVLC
ncbi:hypothetical protein [Nocardioides sp. GY 10127]|uniref:hypothetical protein n=1 Tax=Nocardioides sp. GY 10127 TaxID=2569762 RepID=UPI0010A93114|nr:hypothetical protein [Nocardioides sp. GY 10127]TIC78625.1 hypothetical protein E8D37_19415 [Nocardioides sp. GY 10127]